MTAPILPNQITSFIGRSAELYELTDLLQHPDCRLLTLIGLGGIGKTRIALELIDRQQAEGMYEVCFVSLQAATSANELITAIAEAIACQFLGSDDPFHQVCVALHNRPILLVLDSFDALLPHSEMLSMLIAEVPTIKLLVTSREALNIQEEWRYILEGMTIPADAQLPDAASTDAVRLFVERARRVRRDLSLQCELVDIVRICHLVEGMPLALELAATWTRTMSCVTIAAEIARSLDFLATRLRNMPERHRSMRATFDQSWALLSFEAQQSFLCLSVFRGGFRHEAAQAVVGATLDTLATLVDTSFLRYEADGRYHMHDLLRQYAAEQLTSDGDERRLLDQAHAAYYLDLLARHTPDMCFGNQIAAAASVAAELQNIRVAWQHAIATADVQAISKAGHGLMLFYKFRSRYGECADAMEQARQMLDAQPPGEERNRALVVVLAALGMMQLRLGSIEDAWDTFQRSYTYARRLAVPLRQTEMFDPAIGLGVVALNHGDYTKAVRLAEDILQRAEALQYNWHVPYAWFILTNAALAQGHYRPAQHAAQQAYAAVQVSQDHWLMTYIVNDMGTIALAMGNFDEARQYYQESYALRESFGAHGGMALALTHLARVALQQEEYAEAHTLYERSLTLYRQIGNRGGVATVLNGLGNTACALGDAELARCSFQQALQMASEMQFVPLILTILTSVSEYLLANQQPERALELLTCVLRHPASDRDTNDQAQRLLVQAADTLAPDVLASTYQQRADLQTLVDQVLVSLATVQPHGLPVPANAPALASARPHAPQQPEQPLVEALTEREMEVLHLIAEGYANQSIAEALTLSLGTIKWYTTQIYSKLAVRGRTQALARARDLRLLP